MCPIAKVFDAPMYEVVVIECGKVVCEPFSCRDLHSCYDAPMGSCVEHLISYASATVDVPDDL